MSEPGSSFWTRSTPMTGAATPPRISAISARPTHRTALTGRCLRRLSPESAILAGRFTRLPLHQPPRARGPGHACCERPGRDQPCSCRAQGLALDAPGGLQGAIKTGPNGLGIKTGPNYPGQNNGDKYPAQLRNYGSEAATENYREWWSGSRSNQKREEP